MPSILDRLAPPPMPTLRRSRCALIALTLSAAAACGSSQNAPPEGTPEPVARGAQRSPNQLDTLRRNTVIENGRPDLPARAGLLVIANQQGASATVLDAATLRTVATLPVGVGPHEVAVSPEGRWAVVTNYGDRTVLGNTLSVIDLAAAMPAVVRTIELGEFRRPHGVLFVASGSKLLVTSESTQRLLLVDFASGRVDTAFATNARGAHMVAAPRDGRRAWTANIADSSVTEFDITGRRTVRTFRGAPDNEGIAATPGGVEVWVGSNTDRTVTILDGTTGAPLETLRGFGFPYRIGISRTGGVAIVNDPVSNRIWMYETGSRKRVAEIDLAKVSGVKPNAGGAPGGQGAGPEGVTFDPISNVAYITLHGTGQVVAVDVASRKVVGVGFTGAGPDGIAFSPVVRK